MNLGLHQYDIKLKIQLKLQSNLKQNTKDTYRWIFNVKSFRLSESGFCKMKTDAIFHF